MFSHLDHATRHEATTMIRGLPQVAAGVVPDERIHRWLDYVARNDPSRLLWHIRRLGGIGGSEIASVIGEPGAYNTPRSVALSKLMIMPPMRPTAAMRRGVVGEDFIREMFEEGRDDSEANDDSRGARLEGVIDNFFVSEMNALFGVGQWHRRHDLVRRIENARGTASGLPDWMIGSPDAVYTVRKEGRELTFPVDFKAPGEEKATKVRLNREHANPWRMQVQYYGAIMDGLGEMPDACVLAIFDYQNAGTAPFIIVEDAPDPDAWARMVDLGAGFWNDYVLQGRVPEDTPRIEAEVPEAVAEAGRRWVVARAVAKAAEEDLATSARHLKDWAETHALPAGTLPIGKLDGVDLGRLRVFEQFDAVAAVTRLIDTGKIGVEDVNRLRGAPVPMPPSHERFPEHATRAAELVDAAAAHLPGVHGIPGDDMRGVLALLAEASRNLRPQMPGNLDPSAVWQAMVDAGEDPSLFVGRKLSLAVSSKKQDAAFFRDILAPAREAVSGYVTQVMNELPPENEPAEAPAAQPVRVVAAGAGAPRIEHL